MDRDRREPRSCRHLLLLPIVGTALVGFLLCVFTPYHSRASTATSPEEAVQEDPIFQARKTGRGAGIQPGRGKQWRPALPAAVGSKNASQASSLPAKSNAGVKLNVLQGTADYWADCWRGWSERLGLGILREELLSDPVVQMIRSAQPSEEERQQLQYQREFYYRDDSVRTVSLTLRLGVVFMLVCVLGFEMLLQGYPAGDLGRALAVPRLTYSPAKAAELSFAGAGINSVSPSRQVTETRLSRQVTGVLGADAGAAGAEGVAGAWGHAMSKGSLRRRDQALSWAKRVVNVQVHCRLHELVRRVLTLEESKVLESAGMDAVVLLRFCALCGRFCALSGIWCLMLVPLYRYGGEGSGSSDGLSLYSVSNLRDGSWCFWAVVPSAYLCNLALCGLLWKEYEHFVKLRRSFLGGEYDFTNNNNNSPERAAPSELHGYFGPGPTDRRTRRAASFQENIQENKTPPARSLSPQSPEHGSPRTPQPQAWRWSRLDSSVLQKEVQWARGVTPPTLFPMQHLVGNGASCSGERWQGRPTAFPAQAGDRQAPLQTHHSADLVREQARRSVLLERLPPELREPAALRACLEDLLGAGSVVSVAFAPPDARKLSELLQERNCLLRSSGVIPPLPSWQ
ncbi:unnamed protein product, partial [Polarella glacialis]